MIPTIFPSTQVWCVQALVSLFLAILFLQSGIDKIVDRRGNLDYLSAHFERTPLGKMVPLMFPMITVLETAAGALSGIGFLLVLFTHSTVVAFWGAVLAAVALTALFFGQRVGKDYAGAAVLVPYFILAIIAVWFLGY